MSFTQVGTDIVGLNGDRLGFSVALSATGNTLIIGSERYDNADAFNVGKADVYEYINSQWQQKGSSILGENEDDNFGKRVSINSNGNIIAIGTDQYIGDNTNKGIVKIYEFINDDWIQIGDSIIGENDDDYLGCSISLNDLGNIIAIGEKRFDGSSGDPTIVNLGRVRIYERIENSWQLMGLPILGENSNDENGFSVSLSSDGYVVAISEVYYDKDVEGTIIYDTGRVKVYHYVEGSWMLKGNPINGLNEYDESGHSISLSNDGNILAIGSPYNYGATLGELNDRGQVRIFEYNTDIQEWEPKGNVIYGDEENINKGFSISLNGPGNIIAVGTILGNQVFGDNDTDYGYVTIYKFNETTENWDKVGENIYGVNSGDRFGWSVSLNDDGSRVAIGSTRFDSEGNSNTGLVRVFEISYDEVPEGYICFLKGTLINTNQGRIPIEKVDTNIHTIRNKKIEIVTKSKSNDKYLVCIEKNALGNNIPCEKTIISKNHKIFVNGKMIKARDLYKQFKNINNNLIYKINYNGEILYNILLKEYDLMIVNNLICETLHPNNKLAKLYSRIKHFELSEQNEYIRLFNFHLSNKKKIQKLTK